MEEEINSKNITPEIIGGDFFDLDELSSENPPVDDFEELNNKKPDDPTADNDIVNILDLFITTSPVILAKYGYPSPDLTIWKDWAKPNLNVAFNHYAPAGAMVGGAVNMPVIAAFIGVAAIGVAFLPVILFHIEKKKKESEIQLCEPESEEEVTIESTTEASEHIPTVTERVSLMEEQVV